MHSLYSLVSALNFHLLSLSIVLVVENSCREKLEGVRSSLQTCYCFRHFLRYEPTKCEVFRFHSKNILEMFLFLDFCVFQE